MDQLRMATEIGQLEGNLAKWESYQREAERKLQSAKGNRTAGAAAVLIGLLLVLFLFGLWFIGAFLILIGALTLFTAMSKQSSAESELKEAEQAITQTRTRLAYLKAQIAGATVVSQPDVITVARQTVAERLEKLADLKSKGLIDEQEYAAQKQKILDVL
jgi:beta-lactamase regulating signal transducer with metallopeptidase domain